MTDLDIDLEMEAARLARWRAPLIVVACLLLAALGPMLPRDLAQHPERAASAMSALVQRLAP